MNDKLFFVIKNAQTDNKNKPKSSSSNNITNQNQTISSDSRTEFSLNDLLNSKDSDLNEKIFTLDKTLQGKSMDEMMGEDGYFKRQIHELQKKKGINVNVDTMIAFKFFNVKKS